MQILFLNKLAFRQNTKGPVITFSLFEKLGFLSINQQGIKMILQIYKTVTRIIFFNL